jgi:hypothetical protein
VQARRLAVLLLSAAFWGACSPGGGRVGTSSVEYRPEDLGAVDAKLDEQIAQEIAYFDPKKDANLGAGEALNSAAGKALSSIDKAVGSGAEITEFVAADATLTELRPRNLRVAWSRDGITARLGSAVSAHNKGPEALRAAWKEMRAALGDSIDMIKFKIVRSDVVGAVGTTTLLYLGAGRSQTKVVQQNAKWAATWDVSKGPDKPVLKSLSVQEFEEISRARPLLREVTRVAFKDVENFEQLEHGFERWWGGLDFSMGGTLSGHYGFAFGDVNNDGLDDLYVCQPGGLPNRLYLRTPTGTLKDVSRESGADLLNDTASALILDLDNDGNQDLVVGTVSHVLFMKGDGKGKFEPMTRYRVVMLTSMAAADYDRDGLVDLYLCEYTSSGQANSTGGAIFDSDQGLPNTLLRNEGRFQFRNVTDEVGLNANNNRQTFAAAWEDFDNDGDQDLYVANDFGPNQLYVNENGRFVERAEAAGVQDQAAGMGVSWGDYNRDGLMDLYVTNMWSSAGNRVTYQRAFNPRGAITRNLQYFARGNSLFENRGNGSFRDVTMETRTEMGRFAWGAHFGDLNNDGWLDIISPNGFITNTDADDL